MPLMVRNRQWSTMSITNDFHSNDGQNGWWSGFGTGGDKLSIAVLVRSWDVYCLWKTCLHTE
jgi:hypothetical protein